MSGFALRLVPETAAVPTARRALGDWLDAQTLERGARDDLILIGSELCANAVRAAVEEVEIRAWIEDGDVVLEVEDDGAGLVLIEPPTLPSASDANRGRGLFLVSRLTDELDARSDRGHTVVRARKHGVLQPQG